MRILTTFPGRFGDLAWALPTVRAIAETTGGPVDLLICGEFAGIVPLLELQPYLARVIADPAWGVGDGWSPAPGVIEATAVPYDAIYHLGYRRWPELPLPLEIDQTVRVDIELPPLDLSRPWITLDPHGASWFATNTRHPPRRVAVGFTECHFELKYGLLALLREHDRDWNLVTCMTGDRWFHEAGEGSHSWAEAAQVLRQSEIFLGDCSALHVLAVAMGKPVVLVEPMEARWNPIFYPCGQDGPQVTLVKGLDGKPTFDSRHCVEALTQALEASHG